MRNLSIINYNSCKVSEGEFDGEIISFTVDTLTSITYAITKTGDILFKSLDDSSFKRIAVLSGDQWLNIMYIPDIEALCSVSSNGEIVSISINEESEDDLDCEINEMGSMEEVGGIAAMAWSPGEEVLAILTRSNVLLTISPEADVLFEVPILDSITYDEGASITWRGDGKYLAINACFETPTNMETVQRSVKIYTSSLEHTNDARMEDGSSLNGLSSSITWCPDNSLIAVPQHLRKKLQISFFESNGLRHGEIVLPNVNPKEYTVNHVSWNNESDVFTVTLKSNNTSSYSTQIWYRENYHWYLKNEIALNDNVIDVKWDSESAYVFRILTDSYLRAFEYTWGTVSSKGEMATAAVINGNNVNHDLINMRVIIIF